MAQHTDVSRRPDFGRGALGQAAGALLADTDLSDKRPVLGFLYNVAASPPGPPSYVVAPTDPEMWEIATPGFALGLLTDITRFAPFPGPPGRRPAPLAHFRVDPDRRRRLDGLALAARSWVVDPRTPAGQAMQANTIEGYFRRGDVTASPYRRDIFHVTAVSRGGTRIGLVRLPGGPVQDLASAILGEDAGGPAELAGGAVPDGLAALLKALRGRRELRR